MSDEPPKPTIPRDPLILPAWPREDPQRQIRFIHSFLIGYARELAAIEAFGGIFPEPGAEEIAIAAAQIAERHEASKDVGSLAAEDVWRTARKDAEEIVKLARIRFVSLWKEGRADADLIFAAQRTIDEKGVFVPKDVLVEYLRGIVLSMSQPRRTRHPPARRF